MPETTAGSSLGRLPGRARPQTAQAWHPARAGELPVAPSGLPGRAPAALAGNGPPDIRWASDQVCTSGGRWTGEGARAVEFRREAARLTTDKLVGYWNWRVSIWRNGTCLGRSCWLVLSVAFLVSVVGCASQQGAAGKETAAPKKEAAAPKPTEVLGQGVMQKLGMGGKHGTFEQAWDRYTVIVWRFKTPPVGPELKASLESAGIHAVHLDGGKNGVSPDTVKFLQETGFTGYLDHAAGKGYLHLVRAGEATR